MQKIYGYKEKDLAGLAEFIRARKGKTLTEIFEKYAYVSGKAKGTVRNMYYAMCKACEKDDELKNRYFKGERVCVNKIVEFGDDELRVLLKTVLSAKKDGKSARSAVMEMSGGDMKTALRYQNKYRSALKNKQPLIAEIIEEIRAENNDKTLFSVERNSVKSAVTDAQFGRLKREIDSLVDKISMRTRKENERLKDRVAALESENLRLTQIIYGTSESVDAVSFLRKYKDMVN